MDNARRSENQSAAQQFILNHCISGDVSSLRELMGVLVNVVHKTFPDGQTCLIAACRNGNLEVAMFLIDECGADVEQVGVVEFEGEQVEGVPPLWCAAAAGHLKIVILLVSRGADVNRTTITNSTALRAACFDGHTEVVRYLVKRGASLEIPNRHGHTCLMISCYRRHDQIVEYLLSKNARVNRRSAKGNTALHDCAESGNLKSLQLLMKKGAIMRKDEYGQSPIMSGANAAYKKIVDFLDTAAGNGDSSKFGCYTKQPDGGQSSGIGLMEKIAAYELLGASLFDRHSQVQDALNAWFKALTLRQEAGCYPKYHSISASPCVCNTHSADASMPLGISTATHELDELTSPPASADAWSLVSVSAREAVAGMELLRFSSRHSGSVASNRLPYFSCPTSPHQRTVHALTHDVRNKRRRRWGLDAAYQLKWKQLQQQLQTAYQRREVTRRYHGSDDHSTKSKLGSSSTPLTVCNQIPLKDQDTPATDAMNDDDLNFNDITSTTVVGTAACSIPTTGIGHIQTESPADVVLGVEPVCFVANRYHQSAMHQSSYYFQRRWHSSDCYTPPRTTFRCCYRVCPGCLRTVVRFGSGFRLTLSSRPISPTLSSLKNGTCKRCSAPCNLDFTDESPKIPVTTASRTGTLLTSGNSRCPNLTIVNKDNEVETQICPRCGLVSEQHPLLMRLRQCGEEAFGHVREFSTHEELNEMMRNTHAIRLQPLLIRLRILGPNHPDTIYFIRYRGAIYAGVDNFRQCLNLWRYALELQRIFLEPLCHVSQTAFVSFAELFQFVLTNNYAGLLATDLDPTLIIDCLELAVDNIERGMDYSFFRWHRRHPWSYTTADKEAINLMRHVALCLHFTSMLLLHYLPDEPMESFVGASSSNSPIPISTIRSHSLMGARLLDIVADEMGKIRVSEKETRLPLPMDTTSSVTVTTPNNSNGIQGGPRPQQTLSPALRYRFISQVYRLVRLDPRVHHGHSLVHLACSPDTSIVGRFVICQFPNLPVIRLLLQLGADPDCIDVHGQRALDQVLANRRLLRATQASLLVTLVEGGAHLDAYNQSVVCASDPKFRSVLLESGICPVRHRTLACLAASVIRRKGLSSSHPVVRAYLPEHLLAFLDMH